MKQFIYVCTCVVILGCLGITASFAGESRISNALVGSNKGVQAQSSKSRVNSMQFQNVAGMLKEIQGNVYIVQGEATEDPIRVEIGKDTAFPNGQKEPGQMLHALISTNDGHALIIR